MISSFANFINEAANYWPTLIDATLKSTLWLIFAISVMFVTRPLSANLRHALSVAAALGCALVFTLSLSPLPSLVGFNLAERAYPEVIPAPPSSISIRLDNAPESPSAIRFEALVSWEPFTIASIRSDR